MKAPKQTDYDSPMYLLYLTARMFAHIILAFSIVVGLASGIGILLIRLFDLTL